jgi:bifunctional UDP-N-acetylglucosamine pyrophosphorylase/glucosamine-1-phosphate N-acetyltransferase
MPLPRLFASLPPALADRYDPEAPWELLGAPLKELLAALPDERLDGILEPGVHISGNGIVIGKGSRVRSGAVLQGPVRIGEDCDIRPGAFLRGGVWLEDRCTVGANTEVKHAILLAGAAAPHLNYVGDSILGERVNLGAGTILSNFRHDGRDITLGTGEAAIATGRRKLGAILGDRVMTGCNCVLNPGCVVGAGTRLYSGVQLRSGVYPAGRIVKLRQELEIVERRGE